MFNQTHKITFAINGGPVTNYLNKDGDVVPQPELMEQVEADVVMNRIAVGRQKWFLKGFVISWILSEGNNGQFAIDRMAVINNCVVEYEPFTLKESELMFIMAENTGSNEQLFVRDMLAEDPFVDDFVDCQLFDFTSPSISSEQMYIHKQFVHGTATKFHEMYNDPQFVIHVVPCIIKE